MQNYQKPIVNMTNYTSTRINLHFAFGHAQLHIITWELDSFPFLAFLINCN